jgi:DNA-binding beta-propeller fold protein YncE
VQKFDLDGRFLLEWGTQGTGPGEFDRPIDVAIGPRGGVYVTDHAGRIQRFSSSGLYRATFGGSGSGDGQFDQPRALAIDSSPTIFVADSGNDRVQKLRGDGFYVTQWGSFGSGPNEFNFPMGIEVDPFGIVYVADSYNDRVVVTDASGIFLSEWHGSLPDDGLDQPSGIAVDPLRNDEGYNVVYVTDVGNQRVVAFASTDGAPLFSFGAEGGGPGQFMTPLGIAVYRPVTGE